MSSSIRVGRAAHEGATDRRSCCCWGWRLRPEPERPTRNKPIRERRLDVSHSAPPTCGYVCFEVQTRGGLPCALLGRWVSVPRKGRRLGRRAAWLSLSSSSFPQGGAVLLSVRASGARVVEVCFAGRRWRLPGCKRSVADGARHRSRHPPGDSPAGGGEASPIPRVRVRPRHLRPRNARILRRALHPVRPPQARLLTAENVEAERRRVQAALRVLHPRPLWDGPFLPSVPGVGVSAYGVQSVYQGRPWGFHRGVDLRATAGEPVRTSAAGIVRLAEKLPLSGQALVVDHGLGVVTGYLQLSRVDVQVGQRVTRGQPVGLAGGTGLVTGPDPRWGMWVNGVHVDPWPWTRAAPHPRRATGVR